MQTYAAKRNHVCVSYPGTGYASNATAENSAASLEAALVRVSIPLGGTGRDADAHVRVTTFLAYFSDFRSNIKVFGQNNMFFQLLQQKPCRIIMKFRQKPYFEHKTCEIGPKL